MMISFPVLLLRLGVAMVLGAIIGLERESTEHAAGLRTQALVALGSSLFTIISAYGFLSFLNIPHVQIDPTRIASYIVAGIGFLGAGSIFLVHNQERVRGLTTAASVWLVAAVGMACGAGLLLEAIATTILALIVLVLLRLVERALTLKPRGKQTLLIETESLSGSTFSQIYESCTSRHVVVEALKVRAEGELDTIEVLCHIPDTTTLTQLIDEMRMQPGVRAVQIQLHNSDKENLMTK
ncbi:MAG TPA: MgtC/SapB family protein [Ktedonosporobacter sp.]|nr:MgtC/SapB family protein [Ktedonosporobacter sp.]